MVLRYGTIGDDEIIGSVAADELHGGPEGNPASDTGRDRLEGGLGNDTLFGYGGDDTLLGGADEDVLSGDAGDDLLDGGPGRDRMFGGTGNDIFVVDSTLDEIFEFAGEGHDTVRAGFDWILGANFEDLELLDTAVTGQGNGQANRIQGHAGDNNLYGHGGNDLLLGGGGNDLLDGGLGNDILRGGTGNDLYMVNSVGDVVEEAAGEGLDTVWARVSWSLGANVENLVLRGAAAINGYGNALDNRLEGNLAANVLEGGAGNDWLDGGTGGDTLRGGAGDDTYTVYDATDLIEEAADGGIDRVRSAGSWTLAAHVEHLVLLGSGDTTGTGNAEANQIRGTAGSNILSGMEGDDALWGYEGDDWLDGGTGRDVMRGGLGDDTYGVDNAGDAVLERVGEGNDTVRSSITYRLGSFLENLVLLGSADLTGNGNALVNHITGNAGANLLRGYEGDDVLDGGEGADVMRGGVGNDTYYVDHARDLALEAAGEGFDIVFSTVDFTLTGNVEELHLQGSAIAATGTNAADGLFGNAMDNNLRGRGGDDTLYGMAGNDRLDGGAGNDLMVGGLGDDRYIVDSSGDRVVELEGEGEGRDSVYASVDFFLYADPTYGGAFAAVERLVLTGNAMRGGGAGIGGVVIGTDQDNSLRGRAAEAALFDGISLTSRDTLYGHGGDDILYTGGGTTTMYGGAGDDIYYLQSGVLNIGGTLWDWQAKGSVRELAGEGIDTVVLEGSRWVDDYALPDHVENLTLLDYNSRSGVRLSGNGLDNRFILSVTRDVFVDGGAGNDTLDIQAGTLRPFSLTGGAGQDRFILRSAFANENSAITDFQRGEDLLVLTGSHYGLESDTDLEATGRLAVNETGTATSTLGQFVLNTSTGRLSWDADGTGSGAAVTVIRIFDADLSFSGQDILIA